MAIDRVIVERRLKKLEEQIVLLRELQEVDRERFLDDPHQHIYALHLLQTAIQCILDIGAHLVAALNLGRVDEYRDIAKRLVQGGIVLSDFQRTLERMIGLRNLIVHEYLDIDYEQIYRIIQEDLEDLATFAKHIEEFLEANPDV